MTTYDQALVPRFSLSFGEKHRRAFDVVTICGGVLLLAGLAQIAFHLPWTPVPITGQTFGITLMALLWGRKRGTSVTFAYLVAGAGGLPVFAFGKSGIHFGPTLGYLIGMLLATWWIGSLADRGWARSFRRCLVAALFGDLIILACGLAVLAFFVPRDQLLMDGLLPFLPGDLVKSLAASTLAFQAQKSAGK